MIFKNVKKWMSVVAATAMMGGCAVGPASNNPADEHPACQGKCDSPSDLNPYEVDLQAMTDMWNRYWQTEIEQGLLPATLTNLIDAFSVTIDLGEIKFQAPTHYFGQPINAIPYCDPDNCVDAKGQEFGRGDKVLAKYFWDSERGHARIGYAIKNHRHEHRYMNLAGGNAMNDQTVMKEAMKLFDTHIEIVVGVERDASKYGDNQYKPGAITFNNPQNYPGGEAGPGRFGDTRYPMIFVKPAFPDYISDKVDQFEDNIVAMLMGFNAVTKFPGDYNGGDPLGARSPEKVRELTGMMIRAMADGSDFEASRYFENVDNKVYCAELAHLSTSAGLLVPLNDANVLPLLNESFINSLPEGAEITAEKEAEIEAKAQAVWAAFQEQVAIHNAYVAKRREITEANAEDMSSQLAQLKQDAQSDFTKRNGNYNVAYVVIPQTDADLQPAWTYAPADQQEVESQKIAFQPMTMADIVRHFVRTHFSRKDLTEKFTKLVKQGMAQQAGVEVSQLPAEMVAAAPTMAEEQVAQMQKKLLQQMKPGVFQSMNLPAEAPIGEEQAVAAQAEMTGLEQAIASMPEGEERDEMVKVLAQYQKQWMQYEMYKAVNDTYDGIVEVVGKTYAGSYEAFLQALEPLMETARTLTGPRGDSGTNLFAPPHMFHIIAQGTHPGGLVKLDYLGHGVHASAMKQKQTVSEPEEVLLEDGNPFAYSCQSACGKFAPAPQTAYGQRNDIPKCYCDPSCMWNEDDDFPCCLDFKEACIDTVYPELAEDWSPAYAGWKPL